jgi:hypothetical protein
MTESTPEQRQQFEAAARSAAAKLQTFHDGLTDDEQVVLDLAIRRYVAGEGEADAQGYMKPLYEGDHGEKGRPVGSGGAAGGTGKPAGIIITGVVWVLGAGAPKIGGRLIARPLQNGPERTWLERTRSYTNPA